MARRPTGSDFSPPLSLSARACVWRTPDRKGGCRLSRGSRVGEWLPSVRAGRPTRQGLSCKKPCCASARPPPWQITGGRCGCGWEQQRRRGAEENRAPCATVSSSRWCSSSSPAELCTPRSAAFGLGREENRINSREFESALVQTVENKKNNKIKTVRDSNRSKLTDNDKDQTRC